MGRDQLITVYHNFLLHTFLSQRKSPPQRIQTRSKSCKERSTFPGTHNPIYQPRPTCHSDSRTFTALHTPASHISAPAKGTPAADQRIQRRQITGLQRRYVHKSIGNVAEVSKRVGRTAHSCADGEIIHLPGRTARESRTVNLVDGIKIQNLCTCIDLCE